jgi:hypothetical protein
MTEERSLLVFTAADSPGPSPWSAHKRVAVLPVSGPDMISRISRTDRQFLLDLIEMDTPPLEEVFKRNGTILADPWDAQSDPGWFTCENISDIRVAAYTPLIYNPALLEIRRLLEEKELGDLAGIELSASTSFRAVDLLYTAAHLLGPPSGCKIGKRENAQQDFESFLWYANTGCSVRLTSSVGSGQLEIKAACRYGMLHSVSEDPVVRVFPAGKEAYCFPLPDGDGIYYNLLDVIDTVLSPLTGGAVSARETANAIRWVQECANERPSLLL